MIFLVLLQLYFHSGTRSQKVNNKILINLLTPSIIEPTASRPMSNHPTRLTDNKFSISFLTPSRISLDEEILPREAISGAPIAKKNYLAPTKGIILRSVISYLPNQGTTYQDTFHLIWPLLPKITD